MEKSSLREVKVLVIGGSAGSLDVIIKILGHLPENLNIAIIIILHRKSSNDSSLPLLLDSKSTVTVKEVEEKEQILPGIVYLAPADYHLLLERDHTFSLDSSEKVQFSRPSIDVTFQSAADVYGKSLAGLLLSGANSDGSKGMLAIANSGGITVVQNPMSADVAFMPKSAILTTVVDYILETKDLSDFVNSLSDAQLSE